MSDDLVKRLRSKIITHTDAAVWMLEAAGRIEELEAKLAKAVEAFRVIEDASRLYASDRESDIENVRYAHECTRRLCVATIAELKGETE